MDLTFAPRQIEFWPIERLRPYARNAKMHGPDQVARIAASMARFGWTVPSMVGDDGDLAEQPDEGAYRHSTPNGIYCQLHAWRYTWPRETSF